MNDYGSLHSGPLTAGAPYESHRPRIRHLDGLRGFAAFAVVLDHYFGEMASQHGLQHWIGLYLSTGWLGVDIFFTLSGFLITGILLDAPRESYFSRFYLRRFFRLAPLYYFYIAVIAMLELKTNSLDRMNLLSDVFYVQDLYLAWLGHWVVGTGLLWSLAIEEQFYLFWPTAVHRMSRRTLACIALAGAFISVGLRVYLLLTGHAFSSYVLPFSHTEGMCLGALLALGIRGTDPFRVVVWLRWVALPAAVALLLLFMYCRDLDHSAVLFGAAAPLLVVLLTASLILHPGHLESVLICSPARWLGRYSYAFYVLQFLPGILIQHWLFANTKNLWLRTAGNVVLIAMLALEARLSWAILEGPMLRLRERLYPERKAIPISLTS